MRHNERNCSVIIHFESCTIQSTTDANNKTKTISNRLKTKNNITVIVSNIYTRLAATHIAL